MDVLPHNSRGNCDLLLHLDYHKSIGLDGIYPQLLRNMANMLAKPLSIIYQQSCSTGQVSDDWRPSSVMFIYQKGRVLQAWGIVGLGVYWAGKTYREKGSEGAG